MLRAFDKFLGDNFQDANAFLARLRHSPRSALEKVSIGIRQSVYRGNSTGGRCGIICRSLGVNFYELEAVSGGQGDYFFPFVRVGDGGVGSALVPLDVPYGTIVLTNSVNGCAIQVNRRANGYEFYHDANGSSMTLSSGKAPAFVSHYDSNLLYRVTAEHYWQQKDANLIAAGTMPLYQVFFIRTVEGWLALQSFTTERREGQKSSSTGTRVLGAFR